MQNHIGFITCFGFFNTGQPHLSSSISISRPSMCHLYTKEHVTDCFLVDLFTFSWLEVAYARDPCRFEKLPIVLISFRRHFLHKMAFRASIKNSLLLEWMQLK